ncbi:MAG: fatty acid CoA ligase family protein [Desulforhopalus sp.]
MVINIAETFVEVAKDYGSRTAVIEARTAKKISFTELNSWSDGYANYFRKSGINPGNTVVLMVSPSIDFLCLTLALFKIGSPIVLIDPGMGYKNLLRCIERIEPRFLVGVPKAVLFAKLFPEPFKTLDRTFCCGLSWGFLGSDIRRWRTENTATYRVYHPDANDLAAIIFTTGSTGPPKGVRYEHAIFSAQLRLIKEYYRIGPEDVDQPGFPLFALFSAALGARTVIPDMNPTRPARVNPKHFVSSITKYGVTYSFGSPAIWNEVSRYCREREIVLEGVQKVLMAGAPVPYNLIRRVKEMLPADAEVHTPYGATESLPIVSIEGKEVIGDTCRRSRSGGGTCVGKALPGIEIKIIAISDGPVAVLHPALELGKGEIGEIIVRGDVVTKGYFNLPEEDRMAKIVDGDSFWHRMGDVGYLDEHDRLWFCGRRAHRVVTGDKTLFSVPCEAIINEHGEVFRSALVGIQEKGGDFQTPVIVVQPVAKNRLSSSKLLSEVRELAAQNKQTAAIKYFLIHDDFPVDIRHNAKIFREKLAIWAQKKICR